MYITMHNVAFYSNVFGYVTKLLIPITSVIKISKEKTVKIFPNAIAIATADERHVFSSFLSRESAYQLMISIWKNAMPTREIEVLSTFSQLRPLMIHNESKLSTDCDLKGENGTAQSKYTLQVINQLKVNGNANGEHIDGTDNDSSSAISANESIQSQKSRTNDSALSKTIDGKNDGSSCNSNPSDCDLSTNDDINLNSDFSKGISNDCPISIRQLSNENLIRRIIDLFTMINSKLKIPQTIDITYFGILLVILLAFIAFFLSCRINEIKNSQHLNKVSEIYLIHCFICVS